MTTSEPTTGAKCWCCNGTVFKSENDGIASHYICQSCNSLNVIGGGGGAGEPNTECNIEKCVECCLKRDGDCNGHVEPTTGEIVRALRCDGDANNCVDCRYATYDTATILCDQEQNVRDAADRLESQERTIAEKDAQIEAQGKEMVRRDTVIKELTARAEQAERERDAAKAYMKRFGCLTCTGQGTLALNDPCGSCRDKSKWEMRGLPQDGDGV